MYKYKRCVCILLLFTLFSILSVPALADDVAAPIEYDFTQDELEYGIFYPTNKDFVLIENGKEVIYDDFNLLGDVQDNSSALKAKVGVYSRALNWRTDEEFTLTSSIGYTKLFTNANLSSVLSDKVCKDVATWENLMSGQFGYTIQLYYGEPGDDSNLSEDSKIGLSLDFPCKVYSGSRYSATPGFKLTNNYLFHSVGSVNYLTSDSNILNLTSSYFSETKPTEFYNNVVTVGYIDSETGSENVLATYDSISSIDYVFTLPTNASSVYVDVDYSPYGGTLVSKSLSGSTCYCFFFPLMYSFDVSGAISLDSSGVNTGLLKGIIQWLKNILNAILALPQQIADKVIEGVKSLFVPSADDLSSVFETATGKLEERLGFIYQITTWLFDLFNSFLVSINPQEYITVPKLAVPWTNMPDWASVSGDELVIWQEFQFKVIPDGAESVQTIVKTMTSLWAVLSLIACCVDSYHDFVGDSPVYRNSPERMEQKKVAQNFAGDEIKRRRRR